MSTKHTPGPWIFKDEGDETVLYGHKQWVHAIGQPWVPERIGTIDWTIDSPNARLIAAAPDMLEALEEAVDLLESYLMESDREASPTGRWPKLRNAIAKAKGNV